MVWILLNYNGHHQQYNKKKTVLKLDLNNFQAVLRNLAKYYFKYCTDKSN